MNHAANPESQRWAERIAARYARRDRSLLPDLVGAALLGLVEAAGVDHCPEDPDEFRAMAYRVVRRTITEEYRKYHPRRRVAINQVDLVDLADDAPDLARRVDWLELRASLAGKLTPGQARVFLAIYGEDEVSTIEDVATALGITPQAVYHHQQIAHSRISSSSRKDQAADPLNIRWARTIARRKARGLPQAADDVESAALLGMVRAAKAPFCPDDTKSFQAFAYMWVHGAIIDEIRKFHPVRVKQGKGMVRLELVDVADDAPDHEGRVEWLDFRERLARLVPAGARDVFLAIYGEDGCLSQADAAQLAGMTPRMVRSRHDIALDALREELRSHEQAAA